jgi:hypothetical protein
MLANPTMGESRRENYERNNPIVVYGAMQLSAEQLFHVDQLWNDVNTPLQRGDSWDLFSEGTNDYSPSIADGVSRLDFGIKYEAKEFKRSAN